MNIKFLTQSVLITTIFGLVFVFLNPVNSMAQTSFSFSAAGDHGSTTNSNTNASLNSLATQGVSFHLGVGDMSYMSAGTESQWCTFVKSKLGNSFPFEIVSGNHESDGLNGLIDNFTACLPNFIPGMLGVYGKEFYFDYPVTSPIARFIMISPNLTFTNGGSYDYSVGNAHYTWLTSTIDSARASGIPWVIVGMHKNCITMGTKPCEVGTAIMNLLITKKVDLILQGHDHNYQRSKQLSCLTTNSYNPTCVVDDGADNQYIKGMGPIVVISGTFGQGQYTINTGDSEAPYFARWMGSNINSTFGFVKYTVTSSQLSAQFVRSTGGTFTDSFTIAQAGTATNPPTVTNTPTPTATPTPSPSLTPAVSTAPTTQPTSTPCLPTTGVGGTVTLSVSTNTGVYKVWLRMQAPGVNSDSVYVQVDSQCPTLVGNNGNLPSGVWTWVDTNMALSLVSGSHAIKLIGYEAGTRVDRILVTTNSTCVPTNLGDNCGQSVTSAPTQVPLTVTSLPSATQPVSITLAPTATLTPRPTATPTPSPTSTPVPTSVPISPATLNLYPSEDTFVTSQNPSTNYGSSTTLQIDGDPTKISYLKFNLSALAGSNIMSAKIRFKVDNYTSAVESIRSVTTSWSESTLTYNNRPSAGTFVANLPGGDVGDMIEADVTAAVAEKLGQTVSISISSTHSDGLYVYSREVVTADRPVLVITR